MPTGEVVLASPIKVSGKPILQILNEIRSWLDHNKIQPVEFKTVVGNDGIGFEIRFRNEDEAERFQQEFA